MNPSRSSSLSLPALSHPADPRSLLPPQPQPPSRRGSEAMLSDGLPSPPISPGHSDNEDDSDLDDGAIVVDAEPRYSGPERTIPAHIHEPRPASSDDSPVHRPVSVRKYGREHADADVRMDGEDEDAPAPKPPLRYLEHEQSRLSKPGVLKLTDFEVKGTLGTGTFGRVLLVRHRGGVPGAQNYFALKVLRKTEIVRLRQVDHVKNERYILSRVRHPFVVDLYATFQDSLNIYMLLSYVPGGELFTHLRRAQRFTPDVARFYLATIALALKYLHSFNVVYRDLKPENLLLDARGYVRLTDFGFAKIVDDRTWTLCGTPEYLAPEIIQSDGHGKAADWWAAGVLAYEMMVGYPPFFDETAYGIYDKILRGRVHFPREMDPLTREFVRALLEPDKSKRLGNLNGEAQDVLDHAWFRGVDWDALERREIRAPIIPHTSGVEDTRHFLHLPYPPADEIPGLVRDDDVVSLDAASCFADFA
ncbi:kinase-like protein [Punctularia strigosozonata HHB-11173 SS5]|uniref:kinase-like protein n=1 Tax=Punctularia strigosozonata (strain HHB-11173) TaxID=741275 RepID=UPI000441815D|nr:kinase-like protein [Punctularia strigosozonata HHB-11173 SS5]EIN07692.1 kinase-like protein [Punctularia strigosozonata HHB-11173 SS5]